MKTTIVYFSCFVILLSAVPGHSLEFVQDIGFRGAAVFSKGPGFERKTQGGSFIELENILAGSSFAAVLTFGYHNINPSGLSGGWGYRGWAGFHGWLGAEWYFFNTGAEDGSGPDMARPRFGAALAFGGFFSEYQYTEMLFFYPALRASVFADIFFDSPFRLRFGIPAELYFRRDLESSFSLGIGVWGGISWSRLIGG
jgi:hypothetical protein